jgi:hypothetical protein
MHPSKKIGVSWGFGKMRFLTSVYNIIPKSREWLTINYVVNAARTTLLGFYIFERERIKNDYVHLCKLGTYVAMQSKAWMIAFLFKDFFFPKRSIPRGISLINKHLFIFNHHGSHVALEAIEQAKTFGLDMVTLPSYTSHALQPLHITCFKPFRIVFKKERDTTMINRNYIELNKLVLARWADKALN